MPRRCFAACATAPPIGEVHLVARVVDGDTFVLENGDRIEIYRPLIADPKQVRKQRAAQGLRMKKGGGKEQTEAD